MEYSEERVDKTEAIREELRAQEKTINQLMVSFKAAVVVASVFGAFGAWGYTIFSATKEKLGQLETELKVSEEQMRTLKAKASSVDESLEKLRGELGAINVQTARVQESVASAEGLIDASAAKHLNMLDLAQREARAGYSSNAQEELEKLETSGDGLIVKAQEALSVASARLMAEAQNTAAEENRRFLESLSLERIGCTWEDIGNEGTHYPDRAQAWCPGDRFIAQLDFDAKKPLDVEVFVAKALCCSFRVVEDSASVAAME